ncbi:putative mitochondrial protein, partial [Tanacetum coccineum]
LTSLLKNAFHWSIEAQNAFEVLKTTIMQAPVLTLPDFDKTFTVETDASGIGFDYELSYKSGAENIMADALSRITSGAELNALFLTSITTDLLQQNQTYKKDKYALVDGILRRKEKTVILVVVDRLSKYAYFIAMQHPFTASIAAQVFLDNVYRLHGLPDSIISDRDKLFLSHFWQSLFRVLKVELKMSTAYHHQSDGKTEIVDTCLECFLRCMAEEKPKEWAMWLPMAEFWYNTNFHSAINTTPFQ